MLPDIDGMIKDIRKQETITRPVADVNEKNDAFSQVTATSDSWNTFIKCSEQYGYRVKQEDRKVCHIDEEIHETSIRCL